MVYDFKDFDRSVYESVLKDFLSRVSQPRPGAQVFRTELGGYLLDVEQEGRKWVSRVYDRDDHQRVLEVECEDKAMAKARAIAFAEERSGSEPPRDAKGSTEPAWRLSGPL